MSSLVCKKCGEWFDRLVLIALLIDYCGAKSSVDPVECCCGGEHEFIDNTIAETTAEIAEDD